MLQSFSILFLIAGLFSYVNYRWIKLPSTIGLMILGVLFTIVIVISKAFSLEFYTFFCALILNVDFKALLMDGMLSFLLFAGAIHVNIHELAKEKIIGLFHGRMEFGPRALGNRSILSDPRSFSMKDRLNHRVKHREAFRPFAASVLWEQQESWFENSFYSPTMEAVFTVKEKSKKKIPAVVHVDGTCRIQSVRKDIQPFYWKLIEAFHEKTF